MTVKEAIDILERSCGFHYNATDKCHGCLFENSGWCGEDFHESLLTLLKEQEAKIQQLRLALDKSKGKCKDINMSDDTVKSTIDSLDRIWWRSIL